VADKPTLRPDQLEDLAFAMANPKSGNLNDPGTGKTPTACVLFYYWWARKGWRTIWAMPKSLMEKNKAELLRFTDFTEDDIVIMESDFAPLTKGWTGPTFERFKTIHAYKVWTLDGTPELTNSYELRDHTLIEFDNELGYRPLGKKVPWAANRPDGLLVRTHKGPDGKPLKEKILLPEVAKDLIAANKEAKVFICTFAFLRNHHERMLRTIPTIGGFGIDEHHMGYGTPTSEQTISFYHVANHCQGLFAMTGTLVDGRLDSAFPLIHAIEPRYYGSYTGFVHEHAAWINDYGKVESWKNEEKLKAILERHTVAATSRASTARSRSTSRRSSRRRSRCCRRSSAAYDVFHEQAMLELMDGDILDGSMPGVAVIRACQIMAHPETMGICVGEVTEKDRRLMEYAVRGPADPGLLRRRRRAGALREAPRRGGPEGRAHQQFRLAERRNAIDLDFRNGRLDAIVGSGPTVAVGYNWERADHVIGVSWDYKDVNFVQAYRRASRGTRTTTLRVSSLVYRAS
jgi:hypothetical protein